MANKTMNTRQKQVFQLPQQKSGDSAVLALRGKRGGAHAKDSGAQRAALKRLLKRGDNQ